MITGTDQTDIPFFKKCVEKYFGLEPPDDFTDEEKKTFKKPQFQEYLRKKEDPTKFTHFEVSHVSNIGRAAQRGAKGVNYAGSRVNSSPPPQLKIYGICRGGSPKCRRKLWKA
jgi:hypothetical protein